MGLAIESVLAAVNTPGATFTAATVQAGNSDSLQIRSFPETAKARLLHVTRRHNTTGAVRILSPLLHDNVNGLTWNTAETPSIHALPPIIGQPVQRGDTLTVQVTGDTTHWAEVMLTIQYDDCDGVAAKLYQWGDIVGNVKAIKALEVDVTASGTVGLWSDTAINTTDKQLHASSQYAVLGYTTDTALCAVGIKGQTTGNLRICGPGTTNNEDTSYYFVDCSNREGLPYIPVFGAIDQGAIFVSVADNAASTTAKITLVLAELSRPLS